MYALGWTQHSDRRPDHPHARRCSSSSSATSGGPAAASTRCAATRTSRAPPTWRASFDILPGYLKTPASDAQTLKEYLEAATPTTLGKQAWASMNYWQNYPKFMVSLLKAALRQDGHEGERLRLRWLPKIDGNYSWMYIFDDMYRGSSMRAGGKEPGPEGLITFGMNPVGIGPNAQEDDRRPSQAQVARRRREPRDRDRRRSGRRRRNTAAPTRRRSRRRSSSSRRATSPRRTARSRTRPAGSSGSGRPSTRPGRRRWTRRSSRGSSSRSATSTARRAAPLPEQVAERLLGLHEPGRAGPRRGAEGAERQGARRTSTTRRTRRRSSRPPASSSTASPSSRTTARRCAATGSCRAPSPRPAT